MLTGFYYCFSLAFRRRKIRNNENKDSTKLHSFNKTFGVDQEALLLIETNLGAEESSSIHL